MTEGSHLAIHRLSLAQAWFELMRMNACGKADLSFPLSWHQREAAGGFHQNTCLVDDRLYLSDRGTGEHQRICKRGTTRCSLKPKAALVCELDTLAGNGNGSINVLQRTTVIGMNGHVVAVPLKRSTRIVHPRQCGCECSIGICEVPAQEMRRAKIERCMQARALVIGVGAVQTFHAQLKQIWKICPVCASCQPGRHGKTVGSKVERVALARELQRTPPARPSGFELTDRRQTECRKGFCEPFQVHPIELRNNTVGGERQHYIVETSERRSEVTGKQRGKCTDLLDPQFFSLIHPLLPKPLCLAREYLSSIDVASLPLADRSPGNSVCHC